MSASGGPKGYAQYSVIQLDVPALGAHHFDHAPLWTAAGCNPGTLGPTPIPAGLTPRYATDDLFQSRGEMLARRAQSRPR